METTDHHPASSAERGDFSGWDVKFLIISLAFPKHMALLPVKILALNTSAFFLSVTRRDHLNLSNDFFVLRDSSYPCAKCWHEYYFVLYVKYH
mmetsp:Transcript_29227/g.67077  ORF Transcript_29227/g.67077 Transcript_29227/m.67077 type:complete len:93 (+) Transcript_29227:1546-1824(+)